VARNSRPGRSPRPRDGVEDTLDLADRRDADPHDVDRYGQTPPDPWPGGIWPVADAGPRAQPPAPRSRVSFWATVGLMLSLVALCATLTGLLALEGLALAVLGLLASVVGLVRTSRPGVNGRGLAVLGLLAALGAAWLAVAALTGNVSWLDSHTDTVSRWHGWLVDHWSWLGRW
jgi:hypothetical protein